MSEAAKPQEFLRMPSTRICEALRAYGGNARMYVLPVPSTMWAKPYAPYSSSQDSHVRQASDLAVDRIEELEQRLRESQEWLQAAWRFALSNNASDLDEYKRLTTLTEALMGSYRSRFLALQHKMAVRIDELERTREADERGKL